MIILLYKEVKHLCEISSYIQTRVVQFKHGVATYYSTEFSELVSLVGFRIGFSLNFPISSLCGGL